MAEVKVTKNPASTPENVIFDFEIPGGEKGDPGGFTNPTLLGNVSLDTVKTPGLYTQLTPAYNTLANSFPWEGQSIVLSVELLNSAGLIQTAKPLYNPIAGRAMAMRQFTSGTTWSPWRIFASSRVDQTAGRAIYQWDDLNNREQLIYGDTGWRDIRSLVPDYVSGSIKARRQGNIVTVSTETLVLTGAAVGSSHTVDLSGGNFALSENQIYLPLGGFFKGAAHTFVGAWNGQHQIRIQDAVGSSQVFGQVSFVVRGAWPTTLPGTASGTIPNL